MSLMEFVKSKKTDICQIANKYGAFNIRIFGSVARGDADENSDIDFLVDFNPDVGLIEWSGFWLALEELLGKKVDVAIESSLKKRMRDRVLSEAVSL